MLPVVRALFPRIDWPSQLMCAGCPPSRLLLLDVFIVPVCVSVVSVDIFAQLQRSSVQDTRIDL